MSLQSCLTVVKRPTLSSGRPRPVLKSRRAAVAQPVKLELPRVHRRHPLAFSSIRYCMWVW